MESKDILDKMCSLLNLKSYWNRKITFATTFAKFPHRFAISLKQKILTLSEYCNILNYKKHKSVDYSSLSQYNRQLPNCYIA